MGVTASLVRGLHSVSKVHKGPVFLWAFVSLNGSFGCPYETSRFCVLGAPANDKATQSCSNPNQVPLCL